MQSLKGIEEARGPTRPLGVRHGADRNRKTWSELRAVEDAELGIGRQPYCLIIGGGQGGIMLGARLKQLGVPSIIVEKNARAGDSWRNRYRSLVLHDPVWYDHLPYIPFPENWPVFTPKDKMGDWLEMYVKVMELNYWGSTEAVSASYDTAAKRWTVDLLARRQARDAAARTARLRDRRLRPAALHRPARRGELRGRDPPFEPVLRRPQIQGQARRRHRRGKLGPRRLRSTSGRPAPTSPWCSARRPRWSAPRR